MTKNRSHNVIIFSFAFIVVCILFFWNNGRDLLAEKRCEILGKEFLTLTNGEKMCTQKFVDAGKSCQFKSDCKGFRKDNGMCSEYYVSKNCFEEYSEGLFELPINKRENTLYVCPPSMIQ